MSEKRYVMKCDDESCYFCDTKEGKVIFVCQIVDILNSLVDENEQLRKQCFELEKDYLIETSDISDKIYLKDEINELKKKYGVKDE